MDIGIKKNHLIIIHVVIILIIVSSLSIFLIYNSAKTECAQESAKNYGLLSERVAWVDAEDFINVQKELTVSYADMKIQVVDFFDKNDVNDRYGLYFEDLTTGAWIGMGERDKFLPASLLKIPTMVAILKKVEQSELSLDRKIILTKDVLDNQSGTLYTKGEGYEISVRELLNYLMKESDNTALGALDKLLSDEEYFTAWISLGLPFIEPDSTVVLSPKENSNIFRSLYLSTYLHRTFSQLALSILTSTGYDTQIAAGIPSDVKAAHKYGAYKDGGYFHDCGIVYAPNKPYMLCIMSRNSSKDEADRMISGLSAMVYNYVTR